MRKNNTLEDIPSYLKGKVVILGIGNTLRGDDGVGSLLASRIKDRVPYTVYDAGLSPENYLGEIIKEKPDKVIIVDAADFGGQPGELRIIETEDLNTTNLFFTHNASISLTINYLKRNFRADIIALIIQPKTIALQDKLSPEVNKTLDKLEGCFYEAGKKKG